MSMIIGAFYFFGWATLSYMHIKSEYTDPYKRYNDTFDNFMIFAFMPLVIFPLVLFLISIPILAVFCFLFL